MKYTILIIMILSFYSCSQETKETSTSNEKEAITDSVKSVKDTFSLYPEMRSILTEVNNTPNNCFYKFILYTDSTCKIEWGKHTIKRITKYDYDFYFIRRLRLEWENESFIVLRGGSGSDTWFNIILPLDSLAEESDIENPMSFSKKENLIVEEGFGDTIVVVHNIKTGKTQSVIDSKHKCESAFNHYCIDSISIRNKELYIKWVLPHKISNNYKVFEKRIKIKL